MDLPGVHFFLLVRDVCAGFYDERATHRVVLGMILLFVVVTLFIDFCNQSPAGFL